MHRLDALGVAILRVTMGAVFVGHGGRKLFVDHFTGVARNMAFLGLPAPEVLAVAATLIEFVGGLLLVLGLFTRWAAIVLAVDVAAALVFARLQGGFFLPDGFEYSMVLLAATVALSLTGPGKAALDSRLKHDRIF